MHPGERLGGARGRATRPAGEGPKNGSQWIGSGAPGTETQEIPHGTTLSQLDRHVLNRVDNSEFLQREATRASRFFWGPRLSGVAEGRVSCG